MMFQVEEYRNDLYFTVEISGHHRLQNMEFKKKKVVDVHSEKKAGYWFLDKYNKCIKNKYNLHKIQWFFITEKVDNDRIKLVVSWQVDSPFEWEIVNPVIHVFCRGRNGLLLELEKPWLPMMRAEASVVQEIESKDKLLIVSIAYKSFNERPVSER
uniref:Uncharacterized protein n=1 Tax=Ditylenchus dipsaci TaxID=166011 RepID=A0A915D5T9_9BILA